MKFSCAKFERTLKVPFRYGNKEIPSRKGIYLKEHSEVGTFISEISPLPGHSKESLEDCLAYLANPLIFPTPPAIQFALAGIDAQKKCFSQKVTGEIESNALIPWEGPLTAQSIESAISNGYKTIKLKVFPRNMSEIFGIVQDAIRMLPSIKIRLDANQSLTKEEYFYLDQGLASLKNNIEYIEEPFSNCFTSNEPHQINWAADESANSPAKFLALFSAPNPPAILVAKPQVLGELPQEKNMVVTSALETEAGRRSILAMLYLRPDNKCAGLSTGFLFQQNFLMDCALYNQALVPSAEELKYYDSLTWEAVSI